jgi:hypothetical protein
MIIQRMMRWARHVAHMGKMKNMYKVLVVRPEGRDHLEDLGVDGKIIILKCVFRKYGGKM